MRQLDGQGQGSRRRERHRHLAIRPYTERVIGWPGPCQEPTARESNGEDPTKYVLSANIHRRNMTKGQRAMAVAKIYPEPEKGGRGKKSKTTNLIVSGGFSRQRLDHARTVLQCAPKRAAGVLAGASLDGSRKVIADANLPPRPGRPRTSARRAIMVDISKKQICADEAFAAYAALGPARSLTRLLKRYRSETGVVPPASSTLKRWSSRDEWQARAREYDSAVQGETNKLAIEREAEQRVEISTVVEDAYRDMLERVRQLLPEINGDGAIMELVSAAGLLHGQLMEIQRGKMPDQGLLEKIVQQMAGSGNGGAPTDDEKQELLELAMAEPDTPVN